MLLSTEELCAKLGFDRPGDCARFLREQGVPYWMAKGKPVTTLQAINMALMGGRHDRPEEWEVSAPSQE